MRIVRSTRRRHRSTWSADALSRRPHRSRDLALALILVFAPLLSACEKKGKLSVENFSSKPVTVEVENFDSFLLKPNEYWEHEFELGKGILIFEPDDRHYQVRADGEYVYEFYRDARIEAGKTNAIEIFPNAGTLRIDNRSIYAVEQLRIARPSDIMGVINWLDESIPAKDGIHDVRLHTGTWKVFVIDDHGHDYTWPTVPIEAEAVTTVYYLR